MALALRIKLVVVDYVRQHPLVDIAILCGIGLLVSILLMTYGVNLSPGLF